MKVIGIVQARMGSSRLYGKILYPLARLPLLYVLAKRLESAEVEEWWLATTDRKEDDLTANWGRSLGWNVYRGSAQDVLSRFTFIIREKRPDYVVRITADDPFTDGHVVNLMMEQLSLMTDNQKILITGTTDKLPLGYAPSIVLAESLIDIETRIPEDQTYHRTHVTSWLTTHHMSREFESPKVWPARPAWRWTVDTDDDARMANHAFKMFEDRGETITYPEMVSILDSHPEITGINTHIKQKEIEEG